MISQLLYTDFDCEDVRNKKPTFKGRGVSYAIMSGSFMCFRWKEISSETLVLTVLWELVSFGECIGIFALQA
jgi:hypothetical protein